ncbi:MAG TPA: hypothetical protein VMR81_03345 [Patescibacteria group bacterium]|nr:hypothetical protein [Patescibacteria group bacterium]
MKRRAKKRAYQQASSEAIAWLPIDSRLFPFFSFTHVRGVARVFLILEMILSVGVVVGTLALVILRFTLK